MMGKDEETRRRAERELKRLDGEGGIFGSPVIASKVDSVRRHFKAGDADQKDRIEVMATRTGRILGAVAFVGLALWLWLAYAPR